MRFFNLLLVALAMTMFTACASTGQSSGTAGAEVNNSVFSSDEARREYLTSHVFEGRWHYSSTQNGDSKLAFYEIANELVASFHDVDGGGIVYDAVVSLPDGELQFQITDDNRWELAFTSEKTLEGTQWYEGNRVDITLNDVSARSTPDLTPVYPVNSADELAELLVEHSPFAGEWRWGTAKSGDVRFTFDQGGEGEVSVKAVMGGVTNTAVPVSIERASAENNRIHFTVPDWGPVVLKLRENGLRGLIKYSDGTALRMQLPPVTPLGK